MFVLNVDAHDVLTAQDIFAQVPARLNQRLGPLTARVARSAADELRDATPLGAGDGPHAKDLWRVTRTGPLRYSVTNSAAQVGFLLRGTRAHEIRPRERKALHWQGPGGDVFARVVHHPGTAPNAELRLALLGQKARAELAVLGAAAAYSTSLAREIQSARREMAR